MNVAEMIYTWHDGRLSPRFSGEWPSDLGLPSGLQSWITTRSLDGLSGTKLLCLRVPSGVLFGAQTMAARDLSGRSGPLVHLVHRSQMDFGPLDVIQAHSLGYFVVDPKAVEHYVFGRFGSAHSIGPTYQGDVDKLLCWAPAGIINRLSMYQGDTHGFGISGDTVSPNDAAQELGLDEELISRIDRLRRYRGSIPSWSAPKGFERSLLDVVEQYEQEIPVDELTDEDLLCLYSREPNRAAVSSMIARDIDWNVTTTPIRRLGAEILAVEGDYAAAVKLSEPDQIQVTAEAIQRGIPVTPVHADTLVDQYPRHASIGTLMEALQQTSAGYVLPTEQVGRAAEAVLDVRRRDLAERPTLWRAATSRELARVCLPRDPSRGGLGLDRLGLAAQMFGQESVTSFVVQRATLELFEVVDLRPYGSLNIGPLQLATTLRQALEHDQRTNLAYRLRIAQDCAVELRERVPALIDCLERFGNSYLRQNSRHPGVSIEAVIDDTLLAGDFGLDRVSGTSSMDEGSTLSRRQPGYEQLRFLGYVTHGYAFSETEAEMIRQYSQVWSAARLPSELLEASSKMPSRHWWIWAGIALGMIVGLVLGSVLS